MAKSNLYRVGEAPSPIQSAPMPPRRPSRTRYTRVNARGMARTRLRESKPCPSVWSSPALAQCGGFATESLERINGPTARFCVWPRASHRRGLLRALAGLKRAFAGLCVWPGMLASAGKGAACLFSLYIRTALALHTARPRRSNRLNLMLWPRLWHGLAYGIGLCCSRVPILSPRRIVARAINPAGYRLAILETTCSASAG